MSETAGEMIARIWNSSPAIDFENGTMTFAASTPDEELSIEVERRLVDGAKNADEAMRRDGKTPGEKTVTRCERDGVWWVATTCPSPMAVEVNIDDRELAQKTTQIVMQLYSAAVRADSSRIEMSTDGIKMPFRSPHGGDMKAAFQATMAMVGTLEKSESFAWFEEMKKNGLVSKMHADVGYDEEYVHCIFTMSGGALGAILKEMDE